MTLVRVFRDPTLQFILSLLVAPVFAILGTSVGKVPLSLAGWLVTLVIWSFFAIRSARHQWRMMSGAAFSAAHLRLRIGITFFAVVISVTAVVVAVLLVMAIIR